MNRVAWVSILLAAAFTGFWAPQAAAQATRTWVSGVGDDVNPCSRTAPCKTFAGAISKTAAAGEINCLDPAGFGAVTITKSITLDCAGTLGSILAAGTNAINVNGAGIVVILRNLSLNGVGLGLVGINFVNGSALHVENVTIFGFKAGAARGIQFVPSTPAELFVSNSVITQNGVGSTGGGVLVKGSTAVAAPRATLTNVLINDNASGLIVDGAGSTAGIRATLLNSVVSGNSFTGIASSTVPGGAVTTVLVNHSAVLHNGSNGVLADGPAAAILLGDSTVTGNGTGLAKGNGASLFTYGDNYVNDNAATNPPTLPVTPKT